MKKFKMPASQLDEMQEQRLLKIENNGIFVAGIGILLVYTMQTTLYDDFTLSYDIWGIFVIAAVYEAVFNYRHGIFDQFRLTKKYRVILPSICVLSSVLTAVLFCLFRELPLWFEIASFVAAILFGLFYAKIALVLEKKYLEKVLKPRFEQLENAEEGDEE